jgi:hypothetical protein
VINYDLKTAISRRNIRQKKVAEDLSIDYGKFRRIIGGFMVAKEETEAIARYLNISPAKVNYRYHNGGRNRKHLKVVQDIV